ncbi:MAG TPA: 2-hydroxyacyl-CoA dehydratase family protein [Desulfomonilaceae bacterium]|nr:2-hydroxyacyl-CoA dehydratase family protein [Desulfomonilaceae bacterium]
MTNDDPWSPFREVLKAPWEHAGAWKRRTGGKVAAHLLPDVPEEIIHAAGALPVAVAGAGVQVSHAQAHIPGYTCSHAMGALELGFKGDLEVADAMIIPYVCDTTRNLFHIWNHCFPDMTNEFLRLPKRIDYPAAREYLKSEFTRLLASMMRLTGRESADVGSSIDLYNRSRARLRSAYEMHKLQPDVWTAERVRLMVESAMRSPREDHLAWMDALPWGEPAASQDESRVPLYVRGKVWDPPGILDLMDRLGFLVVEDEIVSGFRSIALDSRSDTEPLDALADRHVATVPYAGYHLEPDEMVRKFVHRVLDSGASGVLFLNPKFCEAAGFDTPDFQKALEEHHVPSLILETSSRGVSLEQVRLRLEAFREMIAGDLP